MNDININIQVISAPSILGLKYSGVEHLSESLLSSGLKERLRSQNNIIHVKTLNDLYMEERDPETKCRNPESIKEFSLALGRVVDHTLSHGFFPFVLGGDCSIIIGIMSALKAKGAYGLIFLDAHADFYEPEKSITGEVADMDLAIVTGRGPKTLTTLLGRQPYVHDENVIHVGQRDIEETMRYGSADIRKTPIKCLGFAEIKKEGIHRTTNEILRYLENLKADGFWIHYDTDVLSDDINPAVDYRLPEGLQFEEVEYLIGRLLKTGRMTGTSVTIFNPTLDKYGRISKNITDSLGRSFSF